MIAGSGMKQRSRFLGAIGGFVWRWSRSGKDSHATKQELQKADFTTSTQRMGVRFTGRIRDVFRKNWIKKR